MAEQRAVRGNEGRGIAIAVAAHVLIIGLLSVQWTAGDRRFDNPPMEVDLIAETAETSTAPIITEAASARSGEEDATDLATPEPTPVPPLPEPIVRPTPTPTPKQVTRPVPIPAKKLPPAVKKTPQKTPPTKKAGTRTSGTLQEIAEGLSREQTKAPPNKGAPASATAAQVQRAAQLAVNREIQPFWSRNAPKGYEVEELRLTLEIRLRPNGTVIDVRQIGELGGKTESNAPQQQRFIEQAKKSITQAAPFEMPPGDYDGVIAVRQPFRIN